MGPELIKDTMGFRALVVALIATVFTTLVVHEAVAQPVRVEGKVTDTWGNPLEGVQVEAKPADGAGATRSEVTDDDGEFLMIGLDPVPYELTYTLSGYQGVRQLKETRQQGSPGRARRRRSDPIQLEIVGGGQFLRDETAFEAEGGTPSLTLKPDGMFEFEDAEGEGEGNYAIQDLSAILTVRDYDGPDDTYTITETGRRDRPDQSVPKPRVGRDDAEQEVKT